MMDSRIGFEAPLLLLLGVPVLLLYLRFSWTVSRGASRKALHLVLLGVLLVILAGPVRRTVSNQIDLLVVVDRSRSMPADSGERIRELISLLERQRKGESRIGVVSFGADVRVEQAPTSAASFGGFQKALDPDGSNLGEALETALQLVHEHHAARILVLSDGLASGRSPLAAASLASIRGIPVDSRLFERPRVGDVAVQQIRLPAEIDAGGALQVTAWMRADQPTPVKYACYRGDTVIAAGETTLPVGNHPLLFRDRLPVRGGLYSYRVEVLAEGDFIPENNHATGVLRANDLPRVLLVTTHPDPNNLRRVLEASGYRVDAVTPEEAPLSSGGLDAYRAVILENVAAGAIGADAQQAIRRFVETEGGGLLMTGGKSSFGVGGYCRSDLDPILPVSLEMRKEERKFKLAMAIALDRSGSMAAPVDGGLQKMDLANRGAAEAVKTLTSMDEISVIAVDSAPHVVVPLTKLEDPAAVARKILGIESAGGGIYVYEALVAAGRELSASKSPTRHIVLFADAADAEEPGAYVEFLDTCTKAGITVSVIGLGTDADCDAELLKDVALRGKGRIFFTDRAEALPQVFAQETLSVARSTFLEEPTGGRWLPDVHLLGELKEETFPKISGYNVAYLRPRAAMAAVADDEGKSPLLASWHRGAGRVAAFLPEVDGATSEGLLQWPGYSTLFSGLTRWLMGRETPPGISVTTLVEEPDVTFQLEVDPESEAGAEVLRAHPMLTVLSSGGGESSLQVPFEWTGERSLEARFTMKRTGVYLPIVRVGDELTLKAAPVTLPYSPEFVPPPLSKEGGALKNGAPLLEEIAERTGGTRRESLDGIFEAGALQAPHIVPLRLPFLLAALLLLLFEVAARRLHLWELGFFRSLDSYASRVGRALYARFRGRSEAGAGPPAAPGDVVAVSAPGAPPNSPPVVEPQQTPSGIESTLDQVKRKARKRFGSDGGK